MAKMSHPGRRRFGTTVAGASAAGIPTRHRLICCGRDPQTRSVLADIIVGLAAGLESAAAQDPRYKLRKSTRFPLVTRFLPAGRLDKDNQTALDGTLVWKTLAERDKAFDKGDFDKTTLLFQLRDADYGKSLSTIRADFYRSTRLPLLYDGDTDLRNAIFEAVNAGNVVVLNNSGEQAVPARPADINLGSTSYILERPVPNTGPDNATAHVNDNSNSPPPDPNSGTDITPTGQPTITPHSATATATEARVTFTLMGSAFDEPNHRFSARQLFILLGDAIDEEKVSYGKFQIEVTVPQAIADEAIAVAEGLGLSPARTDV